MSLCHYKVLPPDQNTQAQTDQNQMNIAKMSCEGRAVINRRCFILFIKKKCKNLSQVCVELFMWEAGEIFRAESMVEKISLGLLKVFSIILAKNFDFSAFTMSWY